jgi:hypothetical protein
MGGARAEVLVVVRCMKSLRGSSAWTLRRRSAISAGASSQLISFHQRHDSGHALAAETSAADGALGVALDLHEDTVEPGYHGQRDLGGRVPWDDTVGDERLLLIEKDAQVRLDLARRPEDGLAELAAVDPSERLEQVVHRRRRVHGDLKWDCTWSSKLSRMERVHRCAGANGRRKRRGIGVPYGDGKNDFASIVKLFESWARTGVLGA